ncbi:MAG: hypothetical protein PWQ82_1580 [Thermosediminibacterales bacterium]|nr:hypothetical protein [Thermosediminibacterales bacterium]
MTTPKKLLHKEVCTCKHLKTEESVYGIITYCELESWAKPTPCDQNTKDFCFNQCHLTV